MQAPNAQATSSNATPAASGTLTTAQRRANALAAQLPAGKAVQVQQAPTQAKRAATGKRGAPPVQRTKGKGRPKPTPAMLAASKAAATAGLRKGAPLASLTPAQQAKVQQAAQATPVLHLARRHNVATIGGTHYHMRKVGTGRWLVQVGKAATLQGAPATHASAPVLCVGSNLLHCVAQVLALRSKPTKGASKPASTRKAAGKAKPQAAPAQAASVAPAAPQAAS